MLAPALSIEDAQAVGRPALPPRLANERLAASPERFFELVRESGGLVRVGVKRSGDHRGIYQGRWFITLDEVRALADSLALLDGLELVHLDSVLPTAVFKLSRRDAVDSLIANRSVDYLDYVSLPAAQLRPNSGCTVPAYNATSDGALVSAGGTNLISERIADLGVPRAWNYGLDGSGVSIGWSDTGIDLASGTWPAITDLFTSQLIVLLPNDGADCSHGNRMAIVSSAPGTTTESKGVAPRSIVVSSDQGSAVIFGPLDGGPFASLARLQSTLALQMGPRVIAIGWGTEFTMSSIGDLIDYMFYLNHFAFFAPAGSTTAPSLGVVFPARKSEVIAVTARTSPTVAHPASHVGHEVDGIAFAPIFLSGPNSTTRTVLDRSSAATAQVAGVAALVLHRYPTLSPVNLYHRLRSTAREHCGPAPAPVIGMINAEAAVGGLCVPPGQFGEVLYQFYNSQPSQYTHSYCLQFTGGIAPQFVVNHHVPHPNDPRCGSVTFSPDPQNPEKTITIDALVWDAGVPANAPISGTFRIRVRTLGCPPNEPDCI